MDDYTEIKAHRTVLLDLYKSLEKDLEKEGGEIPESIKQSQENISAEKFLLAIVGEGKAGKSTFINALLGEEILPFATLQATSEIIEIVKSAKQEVRVTFANGIEQVIEDDIETPENEAGTFLKKIASVNEKYRDIPIVQVNRFLVDHYKEDKKKAVFTKEELEDFISFSELENVHKLDEKIFKKKICGYIDKNISCDKIPKSITLGYPHDLFDFRHFRIVDTPGINAKGGLENQTKDFIIKADAVIYLHKAPPVESKSLANALENELPEKVKEHLILVLTHKSNSTDEKSEELLAEAKRQYPEIGSDNIFFVDSLTELCLSELKKKEMNEIQTILFKDTEIMKLTAASFMHANNDKDRFLSLLDEQADFKEISKRIERDAQNSASNQMKRFASSIQEEYEVLDNNIRARIEDLTGKYDDDSQSYPSRIRKLKKEMESLRRDYNEFTQELKEKFSPLNRNSEYYHTIHQIVEKFINKINQKEFDPDSDNERIVLSYVEKLVADFSDEMKEFIDSLQADFKQRIIDKDVELQNDYTITLPKISVLSVWEKASNSTASEIKKALDAIEKDYDYDGVDAFFMGLLIIPSIVSWIKRRKKNQLKESRPKILWNKFRSEIVSQLGEWETHIQTHINAMIDSFCNSYNHECNGELLRRQGYIEELEKEKETSEKLKDKISQWEKKANKIKSNILKCTEIGGEL